MKLLSLVPSWWRIALAAGLLLVAYVTGVGHGTNKVTATLERERAAWADERSSALKASLRQAELYLQQLQDQTDQLAKVQTDGQAQLDAALADRAAADRRAASLRATADHALDSLRRGTPEAPATAAECAAADRTARVFAELFAGADAFAGVVAAAADAARIAGTACVRADEVTR